jgi:hypothetical protein
MLSRVKSGVLLLRSEERTPPALWLQEPPRNTRPVP